MTSNQEDPFTDTEATARNERENYALEFISKRTKKKTK